MDGNLLLVIPTVVAVAPEGIMVDEHFGHNLRAYLESFEHVTVACPPARGGWSNMVPLASIAGAERCSVILLPEPYREDRYLKHRGRVRELLGDAIDHADYLLFSPHSAFDWSTLATRIALAKGRAYNMEGDWNLQNVMSSAVRKMPWGPNRLRKMLWLHYHSRLYLDSMRRSRVALLQGAAVFAAYKDVAPNPHKVLNVQVTAADRIGDAEFVAKLARVRSGAPLRILYAGRAIAMKGPFDWQNCLRSAFAAGLRGDATWLGSGDQLDALRERAVTDGLEGSIAYPGNVDRAEAFQRLREAEVFLFCHLTDESPRCLTEALAAAAPIVGYASLFSCDLVAQRGGGEFVRLGDWQALADRLLELDRDRERLAGLMEAARESSRLYDREEAIAERIKLMREHLGPARNPRR